MLRSKSFVAVVVCALPATLASITTLVGSVWPHALWAAGSDTAPPSGSMSPEANPNATPPAAPVPGGPVHSSPPMAPSGATLPVPTSKETPAPVSSVAPTAEAPAPTATPQAQIQKPKDTDPASLKALTGTEPSQGFVASTIDGVLVTVGEDIILLSDVQRAIKASSDGQTTVSSTGELRGGALTPRDADSILEQLVNQKVLGQRVKEMGIDVGEDELDSEITGFLKQQNISRESFEKALAEEGVTVEAHRDEFRNQLETQRFIGRVIRPLVTVTDDEVKNYYMQQAGAAANPTQKVRLRSLVINLPPDLQETQRQAKQERVANIRKEVDSGGNFASMVKLYSESPDALKTEGLLPSRPVKDLPVEVQTRLKDSKPGQVVGPLQIGSSVFFFEFLGFEIDDTAEFQAQKTQWEQKLLEQKFKERLDDYVNAERTKVKIGMRPLTFKR